mmetsp:Transcript_3302/g.7729  ORF Transcript_3302/g.7729 Transcript_3302/m.7729 type:complete len:621 (-) Transcript_3302:230-2092(-)
MSQSEQTPAEMPSPGKENAIPDKYMCSITRQIMCDPVITSDGQVYEREAIEGWLKQKNSSPNTNLKLANKNLIPVHSIKQMIQEYLQKHPELHEQGRVYVPLQQKSKLHKKLHDAIKNPDADPAHVLSFLGNSVDIECVLGQDGKTPLMLAVEENRPNIVKELIKHKAHVGVRSRDDKAPLHLAAELNFISVAKILLESKASVDSQGGEGVSGTPLYFAAKKDNDEMSELLIKNGADVNIASAENGQTPLHIACSDGSSKVAKILIVCGSDMERKTLNDETALHLATAYNHPDIATMLYEAKADLTATNHIGNPLHYAISEKHEDLTRMMIKWKVDIEAKDRDGDAPLALAAMKGFRLAVELLVEEKADIEAKSNEDRTALHHASSQGHKDLVIFLLDHGAPINVQTIYGQTPLNRACVKGRLDVTKTLIEHNANFELPDRWGATPLFRAARNNRKDVVEHLVKVGANMDTPITETHNRDQEGNTPLHTAAWRGHEDVVRVLLDHWADYSLQNSIGETPAETAADKDNIVEIIATHTLKAQRSCPVDVNRMKKENFEMKHVINCLEERVSKLEKAISLADLPSSSSTQEDTSQKKNKRKASQRRHFPVKRLRSYIQGKKN